MSFMPNEKPKIIFAMEEDLLKRIDDYRFENRINSRSEAIRRLIEEGLKKHLAELQPREK
jgi:metal-responsive CopG/Arc/MetJ family transcriptional regulator